MSFSDQALILFNIRQMNMKFTSVPCWMPGSLNQILGEAATGKRLLEKPLFQLYDQQAMSRKKNSKSFSLRQLANTFLATTEMDLSMEEVQTY